MDMTQGSDQAGAADANTTAAASTAAAGGVAGAMTLGSILTVAGILLLFVFFAAGLISLQYCFNAWDRRGHQGGDASARRRRRGPRGDAARTTTTRGVDPDLLRSLPVTVYRAASDGKAKDDGALDCAVCLAELEDGEEARFLPRCGHGFHADCVDMWLASHTTCPLCRLTVAKPDDAPPVSLPLHPVPHEPANYADLPASVLIGAVSSSDQQQGAVAMATDAAPSSRTTPSAAAAAAVLVIDIPEVMMTPVTMTTTPRDTLKSPASARLRSIRRLWSFGRQGAAAGPGSSSSCSCAGAGPEEDDLEQGSSVPMPKAAAAGASATRGAALHSVAPDGT